MDEKQIIMRLREIEKHYIRGGDEKFDEGDRFCKYCGAKIIGRKKV